jgi:uncharacterized protein
MSVEPPSAAGAPARSAPRESYPPTSFEAYRGGWAVVTGASRGLGMGYATALARRGLDVVLIARDAARLDELASRLREEHAVRAHVVAADLSRDAAFPVVQAALEALDRPVSVLINNAGGSPPEPGCSGPFYGWAPDVFLSFLALNAHPTIRMTQMVLRGMVTRDSGYVLNVASLNGLTACDDASMYCAAKAYVISYSACVDHDLRRIRSKVAVECVCPGRVATDGILRSGAPSPDVPDPVEFASRSLDCARTPHVKIPWPEHWERRHRYGEVGHFDLT